MTSDVRRDDRILGSLRSAEGNGVVRMDVRYATDIDDLWSALTNPRRGVTEARWDELLPAYQYLAANLG